MLQLYSDGLTVAAGAAVPLNNITYAKGNSATHLAPATISLNQRGVYLVKVDAYGSVAAAGEFGVQVAVNGVPRLDAINESTVATGDMAAVSTNCIVTVQQSDCPCNCTSSATTVQVINPSEVEATDAHYNVIVTKLC